MVKVQQVALPRMGALYRKALVDELASRVGSTKRAKSLPDQVLECDHPGITADAADAYRHVVNGQYNDGATKRTLPSVLIHTSAFPLQLALMSQEDFPLKVMGMVHLSNRVEYRGPIVIGQPLRIRASAQDLRPHRRGTQVDVVVEISDASSAQSSWDPNSVLWRGVSTYLNKGTFLAGKSDATTADSPNRESVKNGVSGTGNNESALSGRKTAQWALPGNTGIEFAKVSGDFNPIHVSQVGAKLLGMKSRIAHGMYSAARVLEGIEPEAAGHQWEIEFGAPVFLPAKVAVSLQESDGSAGYTFSGWNPKSERRHFSGKIDYLP